MKTIAIITLGLLLVSCGKKTVHKNFYVENPYDNTENDSRLNDIEQRLDTLESSVAANISAMNDLGEELEQSQSDFTAVMDNLQEQIDEQVTQIAVLNGYNNIVEYLNPCNDGVGYDELLLRMSNGKVVAYFESGNNRFLSELIPNTFYQTTDSQHCVFRVDINGNLI